MSNYQRNNRDHRYYRNYRDDRDPRYSSYSPRRRKKKKSFIRKIKRMWRRKENRAPLVIMASIACALIIGIILLLVLIIAAPSGETVPENTTQVADLVTEKTDSTGDSNKTTETTTEEITTTESTIKHHDVIFTRDEIAISDDAVVQATDTNWHICVNLAYNMVIIYQVDEYGNETPVKSMICSVGKVNEETTQGEFHLGEFITGWCYMIDGTYGQYSYRIIDGYKNALMFHAIPYYEQDRSTLVYEEFNLLGTAQSMGCVRLMMEDAIWLGTHCGTNTPISIYYDDSIDEPLSRPQGYFIPPKVEEIRGWDPTDPLSSNPWHYYEYSYDVPDSITLPLGSSEDDIYYSIVSSVTAVDSYGYDVSEYTTYSGSVDTNTPGYYPVETSLSLGPITATKEITIVIE